MDHYIDNNITNMNSDEINYEKSERFIIVNMRSNEYLYYKAKQMGISKNNIQNILLRSDTKFIVDTNSDGELIYENGINYKEIRMANALIIMNYLNSITD
jgi:predicted DNA-binding protein (UPF0251 family)